MNKKFVAFLLVLVMIISLLAACKEDSQPQGSADAAENGVKLWYAYNTENLMQDLEYPEKMAERDSTLRIHGVRNDAEPVQLVITPGKNIISFDMQMAKLPIFTCIMTRQKL